MISLFSITFEINLFSIVAFLAGIVAGCALLALFYVFVSLKKLNKSAFIFNKKIDEISEEEIKETINKYQEAFQDEKKRRGQVPTDYFKESIWEMIQEIAGKFYPNSKRPLTELTINELILLDHYIIDKIDELLSKKGFSLFRNLKLSTILKLVDTKTKIDNTSVMKTAKKYHFKSALKFISNAINLINPYHWVKKLVINPSINILINKICLICYSIVGEETYNVYSKQAFMEEDENLKTLLSSIDEESKQIEDKGILIEEN